jgi:hypothetical protein
VPQPTTSQQALLSAPSTAPRTQNGHVKSGKISEIDFLADPERIARLDLNVLED